MPDAQHLAILHAACFDTPRPWSASEIADVLGDKQSFLCALPGAFLIGRAVAGESELLTLAVDPERQRHGLGRQLVESFLAESRARSATEAFLEVSAENLPAIALYERTGFSSCGRRPGYYKRPDGRCVDAVIYRIGL